MEYPAGGGAAARPGQMTVSCPIIIIPAAKKQIISAKRRKRRDRDENTGCGRRKKTIVKGIKFNLENEGYQVDVCYDGETAVDMARRGEYAVILLDLMMPKLDGLGACQQIRQFSTVPIIMLTARSEDADKLHRL